MLSFFLDARENILDCLYENHEVERSRVPESEVLGASGYARTDSTGYRKIMKELTKESELVEKKNKELWLTEKGIKEMESKPGKSVARKPKKTNADVEELYKKQVIKSGKGKVPADKLELLWGCLRDRRAHSVEELLAVTQYSRADSTGYREIMKALKTLGLIEKSGKSAWKFIEKKVFPMKE
jgi:predicted transcriptional regulator